MKLNIAFNAAVSGPRKRKKRVRYGDEDFDAENEPPTNLIKTEKESIFLKAEAELNKQDSLVLGKTPLGLSNAADDIKDSSPPAILGPPIAESKVSTSKRILCLMIILRFQTFLMKAAIL